jgi:hypothetical protein
MDIDMQQTIHRHAWDLIPWLVNGSTGAAERLQVEEHLRDCADCRDEYVFQSRLRDGIGVHTGAVSAPHPALQKLFARIDAEDAVTGPSNTTRRRAGHDGRRGWMRRRVRWLAAAVVVQSIGLAVIGAWLYGYTSAPPAGDAHYATLSRGGGRPAPSVIRFVPSPTLTLGAVQSILQDAQVHIVESNAGGTIYGLAFDDGSDARQGGIAHAQRIEATLARLRARHGVLLAEPIVRGKDEAR